MIIMDSMAELYSTDIGENYFAAVIDPGAELQRQYTIEDDDKFPNPRFNTGLMLVNLKKWREDDIERKIFDGLRWYSRKYAAWPDQNVMQMVCKDKILTLDPVYNVSPILKQQNWYQIPGMWEQSSKNPKVIHVCGMPKYWQKSRLMWEDVFWKYAKRTPYYEEFISYLSDAKIEEIKHQIVDLMRHVMHYRRDKMKYWRYKILSKITFGKRRKHYKQKRRELKAQLRQIRQLMK